MSSHLERHDFRGHDGTRLAYYVAGPADGPALVISAGLGGGIGAWAGLIKRFVRSYRIYAWDYRGLYGSDVPANSNSYQVQSHSRDLLCLLTQAGIERPILAGWSMGVQVTLELNRNHAELPRAIIAIHGAAGYPLDTAFDTETFSRISPALFKLMRRHWRWFVKPAVRVAASRHVTKAFMAFCRQVGFMDAAMDPEEFHEMAKDWVQLDLGAYAEIFERLGEHDAGGILPDIIAPTLIIAGGKDKFTPAYLSERMAREIPGAELHLIPNATHFGLMEYPLDIAERMTRFLQERVDGTG